MKIKALFFTFAEACHIVAAFPSSVAKRVFSVLRGVSCGVTISLQNLHVLAQAWHLGNADTNRRRDLAVFRFVIGLSYPVGLALQRGVGARAGKEEE
jgi:hypothetical protein